MNNYRACILYVKYIMYFRVSDTTDFRHIIIFICLHSTPITKHTNAQKLDLNKSPLQRFHNEIAR